MLLARRTWPLLLAVVLALVILVVWPIIEIARVAGEQFGHIGLGELAGDSAVRNTLYVGLAAAALTTVLGVGTAILTEKTAIPGSRWLRVGIVAPILVPPFVSAMSWLRAYGPSGMVDDLVGWSFPGLMGPVGVVIVISVNAIPLAHLLTVAALRTRTELDLEAASRASGASASTTLRRITLPLMATSILGVGALAFVIGINAFGIPALLGTPASFDTMTTRIYQDFARSARPESFSRAILLATGLVLIALVFVGAGERLVGSQRSVRRSQPGFSNLPLRRAGYTLTMVAWALVIVGTVIPLLALVLVSITRGVGLPPTPANWTIANYSAALNSRFAGALGRSALLAALAATLALVLAAAVSVWRRRRLGRWLAVVVLGGFAIPGSALAVGMLLSYGSMLRDTLLLILLAYLAKLWAVGHRALDGSVDNIPDDVIHAARISGATPAVTLRTVTAPMLRPAIVGGWLLVFIFAFHELTMSALLYGPGTDTLAVVVLNTQQLGDVPLSSALAVVLTVPLLLVAIPLLARERIAPAYLRTR